MRTEFEKINTQSVTEVARQSILKKIFSGELKKGEKLPPERELAVQMGISRSSLHQAIVDLEIKGFLEIVPRHGTIVCDYRSVQTPQSLATVMSYSSDSLDFALFRDMMDTRVLLETECARLACENIFEQTIERMHGIVDEMEKQKNNPADLVFSFHYNLVKASGNSIYSMIYRGFEPILRTLIRKHYNLNPEDITETIRLNRQLMDNIENKDADAAQISIKQILMQGITSLEETYDALYKKN